MLRLFTNTFCADNWESVLPTWWLSRRKGEWCPKYVHCLQVCQLPHIAIQIAHNLICSVSEVQVHCRFCTDLDSIFVLWWEMLFYFCNFQCILEFSIWTCRCGCSYLAGYLQNLDMRNVMIPSLDIGTYQCKRQTRLSDIWTAWLSQSWDIYTAQVVDRLKEDDADTLGPQFNHAASPVARSSLVQWHFAETNAKVWLRNCKGQLDRNLGHSWRNLFCHAMYGKISQHSKAFCVLIIPKLNVALFRHDFP